MSFPPGTEIFQFPGFASPHYGFMRRYPKGVGCPIRTSTDQRLLAAPRGLSQRATSFIASWCQGIHRMPFSRSRTLTRLATHHPPCTETILSVSSGLTRGTEEALLSSQIHSRSASSEQVRGHAQQSPLNASAT